MGESGYRTVGELAREAGTTVRTIQYYDQQGLLSPSAKGPGNQRLYSSEDVEKLYRILTLKYLGLSLTDIKERKDSVDDAAIFRELLERTKASLEQDFQDLVRRLSVLRSLSELTSDVEKVNWVSLVKAIESDETGELFWHRVDEVVAAPVAKVPTTESSQKRGLAVAKWHELIADTIALMSDRIAPDNPLAADVVHRYCQLESEQTGSLDQMFILAENVTPHHGTTGSFDVLRDSVVKYLAEAKRAHGSS